MLTPLEVREQVRTFGVPDELTLADGTTIRNEIGAEAFNYYDMKPCRITRPAGEFDAEPDTSGRLPGGVAWWTCTDTGSLDGSRMVSRQTATQKGWM
jgi:hypothetical protein